MSDTSSNDRLTDEQLAAIRTLLDDIEQARNRLTQLGGLEWNTLRPRAPLVEAAHALLAEVERLRAALTRIIERYEQTQAGSHGDEALLPLDHWNLPRAMQQEARDALGWPASYSQ